MDELGNKEPAHRTTGAGKLGEQYKNADIVQPVAQLAYHTGQPEPPVTVISGKKNLIGFEPADAKEWPGLFGRAGWFVGIHKDLRLFPCLKGFANGQLC